MDRRENENSEVQMVRNVGVQNHNLSTTSAMEVFTPFRRGTKGHPKQWRIENHSQQWNTKQPTSATAGKNKWLNSRFSKTSQVCKKTTMSLVMEGITFKALKEQNRLIDINSKSCKTFQKSIDQKSPDWNRKKTNLFKVKEGPKIFRILGNCCRCNNWRLPGEPLDLWINSLS